MKCLYKILYCLCHNKSKYLDNNIEIHYDEWSNDFENKKYDSFYSSIPIIEDNNY